MQLAKFGGTQQQTMSLKTQKMQKTIWIYSRTLGVRKLFLSCLPLKNDLQSGKPAISPIFGVVSKRKKKVSSPENNLIQRFMRWSPK